MLALTERYTESNVWQEMESLSSLMLTQFQNMNSFQEGTITRLYFKGSPNIRCMFSKFNSFFYILKTLYTTSLNIAPMCVLH